MRNIQEVLNASLIIIVFILDPQQNLPLSTLVQFDVLS